MKATIDVPLTQRDLEILKWRQHRMTIKAIAEHFNLSEPRALDLSRQAEKKIIRAFIEAQA